MILLVTLGVTVAAFAVVELVLSLPASRIPRAEAQNLVDEALEDLDYRERKREVEEHLKLFQIRRVLEGIPFSPLGYLLVWSGDTPEGVFLRKELAEAEAANTRGESYEITSIHTRAYLHLIEQAAQQHRRKSK